MIQIFQRVIWGPNMADADLDVVIRQLAKQQHKVLTAIAKKRRDRTNALAAKARDTATKQYYRQLAKDALEIGTATARRLQMSADNAAYSYARAIRQAAEAAAAKKNAPPKKAPSKKDATPADGPTKKKARKPAARKSGKTAKA